MAPDHTKKWMSYNLSQLADRQLHKICLPGSHDAGSWYMGYSSGFGTESNTITQTKSILGQLELGVRWFDIRPALTSQGTGESPGEWSCGHFTATNDWLGWQGANGQLIRDVVGDVNRFTDENPELVVIDVSHIYRIFLLGKWDPRPNYKEDPSQEQFNQLWSIFAGLKRRLTLDQVRRIVGRDDPNDAKTVQLQDLRLGDFIKRPGGGNEGCVVLVVHDVGEDVLYANDFWPARQINLESNGKWITYTQSDVDAVTSTINPLQLFGPGANGSSVLSLAENVQKNGFPWVLQDIAGSSFPSMIVIDNIKNTDLLTLCLASTFFRLNLDLNASDATIVYGGQLITSNDVHNRVKGCIEGKKNMDVRNDTLGCDPFPGDVKSAAIFYRHEGYIKGRWEVEGGGIHFEQDVHRIEYGGKVITDQNVYYRVLSHISRRTPLQVNNDNMGDDPAVGIVKTCKVVFQDAGASGPREVSAQEGGHLNF
jgi:hypothetical protein